MWYCFKRYIFLLIAALLATVSPAAAIDYYGYCSRLTNYIQRECARIENNVIYAENAVSQDIAKIERLDSQYQTNCANAEINFNNSINKAYQSLQNSLYSCENVYYRSVNQYSCSYYYYCDADYYKDRAQYQYDYCSDRAETNAGRTIENLKRGYRQRTINAAKNYKTNRYNLGLRLARDQKRLAVGENELYQCSSCLNGECCTSEEDYIANPNDYRNDTQNYHQIQSNRLF